MRKFGLIALLLLVGMAHADNWPRFRGPNGDGIAKDKEIPIQWKAEDGMIWKVPIPGQGNSSPIVWGNRIYLQTSQKDGSLRQLLCLDVKDGKQLWAQSVPGTQVKVHAKNSLSSSTPATDGKRVYSLFWDGKLVTLHAFTMEGKALWNRELGGYKSQHGYGTSPIVYGDNVFVSQDQDDAAVLLAYDAATGKDAWRATRQGFRACYSTPFVLEKQGLSPELIVASTMGVTSYVPQSGSVNWAWTWDWSQSKSPLRTVASAIYSQGLIFANSGDGGGDRATVAIKSEGRGQVDASHLIWEKKKEYPYVPCMVAHGDHIYFVTDHGLASCAEMKTGEVIWRERLGAPVTASPILVDGKVIAITEEGVVYTFAAEPKFKMLGKTALDEGVLASPAVADNRLYIRTKNHLLCIGKSAGPRTTSLGR